MRKTVEEIVRAVEPLDALESAHQTQVLDWMDSGAPLFRAARPATPPIHLVSYFTLFDSNAQQVLLVDHKRSGLWLPSGGHVEPDEHPQVTVVRELMEELRLEADFFTNAPLFLTVTQTVKERAEQAQHTDVSLWYVLRGDSRTEPWFDEGEFRAVRWFALDSLPAASRMDPHMGRFVAKLRAAS